MEKSGAIENLALALRDLPQEDIPTGHFFANGMYSRVMTQAKDTIVVGKKHKHEHFLIILTGRLKFTDGQGEARVLGSPSIVTSPPGTQRALYALENTTYMTVHKTDKTDLDEIEEEIIEPCGYALFNSSNIAIDSPEVKKCLG